MCFSKQFYWIIKLYRIHDLSKERLFESIGREYGWLKMWNNVSSLNLALPIPITNEPILNIYNFHFVRLAECGSYGSIKILSIDQSRRMNMDSTSWTKIITKTFEWNGGIDHPPLSLSFASLCSFFCSGIHTCCCQLIRSHPVGLYQVLCVFDFNYLLHGYLLLQCYRHRRITISWAFVLCYSMS